MSVFLVSYILACSAFPLSVGLVAGVLPFFLIWCCVNGGSCRAAVLFWCWVTGCSCHAAVFFWCCVTGVVFVRCELLVFVFIS